MVNFLKYLSIFFFFLTINHSKCFIPARIMKTFVYKIDTILQLDTGEVSKTFPHEEIMHRGVHRSVVKYFYQQKNGSKRINLNKTDKEYLEMRNIYLDYYGWSFCDLGMFSFRKSLEELKINVEIVDLDSETKDMPYAHFDAETFVKSNERVINFMEKINHSLKIKAYETARILTGQILHTIQDFYSHSNWIEMGKTYINKDIGTRRFSNYSVISKNESSACISNCTITEVKCNFMVANALKLMKFVGISAGFTCPFKYYKCFGNIVKLDKLVSGYYSGQKLDDGTPVPKPENLAKCSHGGMLDKTEWQPSTGGINKDSGLYLFSPHADLHLKAVDLAIEHTTYFFDQIRNQIGDKEFSKFLNLEVCEYDSISNETVKLSNFINEKVNETLKEGKILNEKLTNQNLTTKLLKP